MKTTQTNIILDYLKNNKEGITSMEAFKKFGATRLSAIIFNLRRKGYNITSYPTQVKTRFGGSCVVSVYKLEA